MHSAVCYGYSCDANLRYIRLQMAYAHLGMRTNSLQSLSSMCSAVSRAMSALSLCQLTSGAAVEPDGQRRVD